MMPKPLETLDLSLLESILEHEDLENKDRPCEWESCKKPAEFWLICPICSAHEVQCDEHSQMIRKAPIGETVIFDRSCNHRVQQRECLTKPIAKNDRT